MTFDVVSLREYLPLGQRVEGWAIDAWQDGSFRELARGPSIGSRRLWRGDAVTTSRVRLRITQAPVAPAIAELALHREPEAASGHAQTRESDKKGPPTRCSALPYTSS